ncbi:endonuclease III [Isachenkonia alkalipeptolytica]|uniref:Endonuclease III n=1 Tax=Isachenkonia alkalipeptolytica TaxID=2565777 RepID=A0AA44BEP7_9CLOT|nr:endonuclease III [Isachenkonia alkalipeptolytica]
MNKEEIKTVLEILKKNYPDAKSELSFKNPFELLIATIMAAQSTDRQVNIITKKLFELYPSPEDMVKLSEEELGKLIKSSGFYRNKSKNILKACEILLKEHQGEVPKTREELVKLPGVGRKTANVVISNVFGQDAIAVDTHVFRVTNRIGIVKAKTVEATEEELMKKIPKDLWSEAHHWFILHGRRVCKARKPLCEICELRQYCIYNRKLRNES